jgi:hypothetical protein
LDGSTANPITGAGGTTSTQGGGPFIPIGNLRDGASNVLTEEMSPRRNARMVRNKKTREALTVANAALEDASRAHSGDALGAT